MSDDGPTVDEDAPDWLPTPEDDVDPEPQQRTIVESDAYPMRVLAGAGTGKTFTMVRKIEHLVEERDVPPDRILALTFTNNAADSMREKLNAKLGTAGYDVDAYTYHSICNDLLTDYAYEAGLDPEFEVVTDAEKYALVHEVLDEMEYRWVKPNVYGRDTHASGVDAKLLTFVGAMKRSGIAPGDVDSFLGSAERLSELGELPGRVEDIASDHLGGRSVSSVRGGLPEVRDAIADERATLADEGIEASLADFLDRLGALCDALETAFEKHEQGDRELPADGHKLPKYLLGGYNSGAPSGIPDDLDLELTDHLRSFLEDCKTARDLTAGYAAYERELDERTLLDFDDLVVETAALLGTDAGAEIADRWEYVFCDEFQDTDRRQFDLVTSLVSDDRLFVVGDDDQAIYEWRGAHVANITDELDDAFGASLADEPLERNFRSRQPILDLANAALDRLDGRRSDKTLTRVGEPAYDGTAVATVEEADDAAERAEQLVTVVGNLLSGAPADLDDAYGPGDVALLVRKNDHATPILEAFDRAGIPYQVAGDLATESVGVGTVVAYLEALARPETEEVSWNRVLTMRYRLHDGDLRRLNGHDDGLLAALLDAPLDEFEEPSRVREARDHVATLLELRETASLNHLYRELKDLTDVERYLGEQERRDLSQLDDVVEQYGDDAVQPPLSAAFVDSLQYYDSLLDESGSTPTSQPELADDAVNVMTIHKSKGLDFPVVLLPRLTADEWAPSSRSYDALETALTDGPRAAFSEDFLARDARETRRVLHVGMTRAEDVLVLQGGTDDASTAETGNDTADDARPFHQAVDDIVPPDVVWRPGSGHIPVWRDLQACLPSSATDWTESLASRLVGDVGGRVRHGAETLSPADGRERVLSLGDRSLEGALRATVDEPRLAVDSLAEPATPAPSLRHSYTSIELFEECPRQHYLEYVVNAFPDYRNGGDVDSTGTAGGESSPSTGRDGVSQREIGLLFHDTAEIAAGAGRTGRGEWYGTCERLAGQRRAGAALEAAKACIDRYFELELSDWTVLDTEREFELDVDGHEVVGFVDAVYRRPDGELVVVDYKATERRRDLQDDEQLPIYLLACRGLYDEPVTRAGYAYVGPIGPRLETREFDASELDAVRSTVTGTMDAITGTAFDSYEAGGHCRWCAHGELPCADEGIGSE